MSLIDGVHSHDDGTASNDAFKKMFRVGIQNKFLRTPEIIKWMGTPTTGDRALDRRLQNNFVEIMASPIACVEYYLMGAPLRFRNAAIPNQILNILRQHIKNWDYISRTCYNVDMPPLEELDDIAEFCELIIKYASVNSKRENAWLLTGRLHQQDRKNAINVPAIGSKRRKIAVDPAPSSEVKTGMDSRAEKMLSFRKNFAKQQKETST